MFNTFQRVLRSVFGGDPHHLAEQLRSDAAHYRQLMDEVSNPAPCDSVLYRYRCLGTGALMPLLLSLTMKEIGDKHGPGGVIETLMMRRALARYASNGLNQLGRTLLQASHGKRGDAAKEALVKCMAEQTAASRRWPTFDEIRDGGADATRLFESRYVVRAHGARSLRVAPAVELRGKVQGRGKS